MSGRRCRTCGAPLRGRSHQRYCDHRCNARAQASRRAATVRAALAGGPGAMAAFLQTLLARLEREAAGLPGRRGRPRKAA